MNASRLCGVGAGLAILVAAVLAVRPAAHASEILTNPGFDDWSGGPSGWSVSGLTASQEQVRVFSGSSALRLEAGTG
ncbi:MAG TPA: hypothetical protein VFY90_03400, partial [Tepidiformaceae bacterium]|nr:hypothetical protein [Tepidiformaceae bacterium]